MSNNDWFRVPLFLPTLEADEQSAWVAVLARWHSGGHFGNRELRRMVGWGAGRVRAFLDRVRAWAIEARARFESAPEPRPASTAGPVPAHFETTTGPQADHVPSPKPAQSDSIGPGPDQDRTAKRTTSRAGDPYLEKRREEIRSERGRVPPPEEDPVLQVYDAWRARQDANTVTPPIPPPAWRPLIQQAIHDHSLADILHMIRWAHEAEDDQARWLQGRCNNSTTSYLNLESLLKASKLPGRLQHARKWNPDKPSPLVQTLPHGAAGGQSGARNRSALSTLLNSLSDSSEVPYAYANP